MPFFYESTAQKSYKDLGIVVNDYTDFDMLAIEACDVIQEMDNAIMFGIGRYELKTVSEGSEVVYTEGMLSTIGEKIKKIWKFIKSWVSTVWDKFIAWISSYIRGDKAFVSKYKKQLQENIKYLDKDFELTLKTGKFIEDDKIFGKLSSFLLSDIYGTFSQLEKQDASITAEELRNEGDKFLEEFNDKIEGFKSDAEDIDLEKDVNANWVASNIKNIIGILNEDDKKIKNFRSKIVKEIERYEKNTSNIMIKEAKDEQRESVLAITSNLKRFSTLASKAYTAVTNIVIKAEKQRRSDARTVCRKILTAKPNPKYNESAFEHSDFESYFNF